MATMNFGVTSTTGTVSSSFRNNAHVVLTYSVGNGKITITDIGGYRSDGYHTYSPDYKTFSFWIGNTEHTVTMNSGIDFKQSGSESNYTHWGISGGSATFDCTGSQQIGATFPTSPVDNIKYSVFGRTDSYIVNGGYTPPSEVTLTNVTTSIGTASVSVYIKGAYTEIQYSKDGSNWQSSNTFNDLIHNQRYTFYARARNNTSSWTTSGGYSATIPGYAPILETITPTVGDTTCAFPTSGSGITYDNAQYKSSTIKYRVAGTSNWMTFTTTASPATLSGLDIVTTYEYEYTITDNHNKVSNTVTGTFTTTGQAKASLKINGTWKKGRVFFKKNGEWVVTKKIFTKINGSWTETKN